jgi:hypothetical protein
MRGENLPVPHQRGRRGGRALGEESSARPGGTARPSFGFPASSLRHPYNFPTNRAPDLGDCQQLQVGPGNKVAFRVFGVGVQIDQWNGTSWVFVAPEAVLFADAGDNGVVGIHFGGPTWQSNSGSDVVGKLIDSCTPDPSAMPWVLLGAASTEGPGIFDGVTYDQRLNTVGGKAPTAPGEFPGQMARVPYTADHVFYRKANQ